MHGEMLVMLSYSLLPSFNNIPLNSLRGLIGGIRRLNEKTTGSNNYLPANKIYWTIFPHCCNIMRAWSGGKYQFEVRNTGMVCVCMCVCVCVCVCVRARACKRERERGGKGISSLLPIYLFIYSLTFDLQLVAV